MKVFGHSHAKPSCSDPRERFCPKKYPIATVRVVEKDRYFRAALKQFCASIYQLASPCVAALAKNVSAFKAQCFRKPDSTSGGGGPMPTNG